MAATSRHVARELNAVAHALFGVQQYRPVIERAAAPGRLVEAPWRIFRQPPAPLIFLESFAELALHQPGQRQVPMGIDIVGFALHRLFEAGDAFVELALVLEHQAEIVARFEIAGIEV
ncbi:MAG: hypothetical protein VCD31_18760 [Alphaproteobacteria bacterium]